jgi:hypothetical protein
VAELPSGRVTVTARHPDFAAASSVPVALIAGAARSVELVLKKGTLLRGRVLDERDNPIADAEIISSDGRAAIADSSGRFTLPHLVTTTKLVARHRGFVKGEATATIEGEPAEVSVDLKLTHALGRLGGQVVDARGNPVQGARVLIAPRGGEAVNGITDAGGRFLVEGLPDGPYRVEVEHAGSPTLRLGAIEATTEARLVLETGGGIEGELFDGRTGTAPADAHLEIVLDGERRNLPLEGRRFRATGLPTGPARLVARAHGYPRVERSIEILAGDRPGEITVRDVRIELELGGQIRGRVRDDRGDPAGGAELEIVAGTDALVEPTHAASDGSFTLTGVPAGRVTLRARAGGRFVDEEVEVRANEDSRAELTLPAPQGGE